MKKIIFAIAALAMVFASCDKTDLENDSNTVKLNITVANIGPDEPVTKAASIKDVWDIGDQIYVWYDANTGSTPDLVITYDGNEWGGPEDITPPHHSKGYVKCVYDGRVKVASKVDYTYSFVTFDFDFNIDSWTCLTEIVVVVTDIPKGTHASTYTLACDKFTPLGAKGFAVGSEAVTATTGSKGDAATGFASYIYEGAAAFAFATSDYSSGLQDFEFTLATASGTRVCPENMTLEPCEKIMSVTLAYSDFTAVISDHEAVQLWKGGPYWATTNIGASTPEEYGYHFAWGYTDGYVHNGSSWVKASDPSSSITFDRTGFPDYSTHAFSDMAAANWGEDWRVPTKTDFDNLLSKCDIEYVTTGAKGIRFTGKGDYSANSIFLPAAGFGDTSGWGDVGNGGFYFSTTTVDNYNEYAYALYFYLDQSKAWVANNKKFCGRSVRPVSSAIFFADPNFKAYCVENFDADGDGELTPQEALAVTAIDCSGKNIGSLVGIEYFSNLETLDCSGNTSLTTLDVSGNTSLTALNVAGTSLTTLDYNEGLKITSGFEVGRYIQANGVKAVACDISGTTTKIMSIDETYAKWEDAKTWCSNKGYGWYLPSKDELLEIYNNKSTLNSTLSTISGATQLGTNYYWSSTTAILGVMYVDLLDGGYKGVSKYNKMYVRAVRAL